MTMLIDKLVVMADELDQKGKHTLASKIDSYISSAAGKKKSPLKEEDDKVKKNLMGFVLNVSCKTHECVEELNELMRRLRYFGIDDRTKEMRLDKLLSNLKGAETDAENAVKDFYVINFGKKPSKEDLKKIKEELGAEEQNAHDPLEFFGDSSEEDAADEGKTEEPEETPAETYLEGGEEPGDFDEWLRSREVELGQQKTTEEELEDFYKGVKEEGVDETDIEKFWEGQ